MSDKDDRAVKDPTLLVQSVKDTITISIRIARIDDMVEQTGRFSLPYPNELMWRTTIDLPEKKSLLAITVSQFCLMLQDKIT